MRTHIDGSKNDIRVLCVGPTDSDDAGLVDGVLIDPPDDLPGWLLVKCELETDTIQEKGEKGQLVTKKVNPRYHCLWARPKTRTRTKRKPRTKKPSQEDLTGQRSPSFVVPREAAPPAAAPPVAAPTPIGTPRKRAKRASKKKSGKKASSKKAQPNRQQAQSNGQQALPSVESAPAPTETTSTETN